MNINPFTQFPVPYTPEGEDHVIKYSNTYDFSVNPNYKNSHIKYLTLPRPHNDVPEVMSSKDAMFSEMETAIVEAKGTNFVLGMHHEDEYHVWRRYNQPCQGGEMRKYGVTHDNSTRPRDPRPGDLSTPFPDGTPLAVGARLSGITPEKIKQIIHPQSVYRRGYGFEDNVQVVEVNNTPIGIIIKDASVAEPTMIVTLFKELKSSPINAFNILADAGYTPPEIFMMQKLQILNGGWGISGGGTDYEGNHNFINLNFLKGGIEASSNLSGGTLGQGYDYNRPRLVDVFKGPIGTNINLGTLKKICFPNGTDKPFPTYINQFRDAISSLKEEKKAA